jgi:hypothetical protein
LSSQAVTTETEVDGETRQRPLDSVDPPAREASSGSVQRSPAGIRIVPYSTYISRCHVSAGQSVEMVPRVGFEPSFSAVGVRNRTSSRSPIVPLNW